MEMEIVLFYLGPLNLVFRKMENIRGLAGHIASLLCPDFRSVRERACLFYRAKNCSRIS